MIFRPQDRDRSDLGASGESRPTHQIGAALVPPDHATQPLHAQLLLALHRTVVAGVDDAWHRRDGIAQNTNEKRTGGKKTIKGGRRKRWYERKNKSEETTQRIAASAAWRTSVSPQKTIVPSDSRNTSPLSLCGAPTHACATTRRSGLAPSHAEQRALRIVHVCVCGCARMDQHARAAAAAADMFRVAKLHDVQRVVEEGVPAAQHSTTRHA